MHLLIFHHHGVPPTLGWSGPTNGRLARADRCWYHLASAIPNLGGLRKTVCKVIVQLPTHKNCGDFKFFSIFCCRCVVYYLAKLQKICVMIILVVIWKRGFETVQQETHQSAAQHGCRCIPLFTCTNGLDVEGKSTLINLKKQEYKRILWKVWSLLSTSLTFSHPFSLPLFTVSMPFHTESKKDSWHFTWHMLQKNPQMALANTSHNSFKMCWIRSWW